MRRWTEPPESLALPSHSRATVASKTPKRSEGRSCEEESETCLYFVREYPNGPVKIGVSDAPLSRFVQLQIASSRTLRLLGWVVVPCSVERKIHARLAPRKVRGEWFKWTPEIRAAIAELVAEYGPMACVECARTDPRARRRDAACIEPERHTCGVFS